MKRFNTPALCSLACGLTVLLSGCGSGTRDLGPTGEVAGTVTLDGNPLDAGSVAFYQPDTGQSGGGQLGSGGQFKFEFPVPVGKYQVSFQPPPPPTPDELEPGQTIDQSSDIAPLYQVGATSTITAEVKEGPNSFKFELSKSGPAGGSSMTPP